MPTTFAYTTPNDHTRPIYPLYVVSRSDGTPYVRAVCPLAARDFARTVGGSWRLEPRDLAFERAKLSLHDRQRVDALYAFEAARGTPTE